MTENRGRRPFIEKAPYFFRRRALRLSWCRSDDGAGDGRPSLTLFHSVVTVENLLPQVFTQSSRHTSGFPRFFLSSPRYSKLEPFRRPSVLWDFFALVLVHERSVVTVYPRLIIQLACISSMVGMLSSVRATRAFLLESLKREGVCRMKFLRAILDGNTKQQRSKINTQRERKNDKGQRT